MPLETESLQPLLLILLAAFVVELVWAWRKRRPVYSLRESLANLGILLGGALLKPATLAWSYLLFRGVEPFRVMDLPETPLVYLLTFLAADLFYYAYHRLSHEVPLLWTIHHTHHSGRRMNLTTAIRLSWLGKFVSPLMLLPLIVLGFDPQVLVVSLGLGLLYQFFLHTEMIGRLGPLEGLLFNTPSAHRVHHGSNEAYIDKNYGAVLIVWDRIFGTYAAETEAVRYGVTTGPVRDNPITIVFAPLLSYLRGNWRREKEVIRDLRRESEA